jgi:hypothetical protein
MLYASWLSDQFEGMVVFLFLGTLGLIHMMKKIGMGGVAKGAAKKGITSLIFRMFK